MGGDRMAVVKTGLGVNIDLHPGEIVGIAHFFRNQRIVAVYLIVRRDKQGIVNRIRPGYRNSPGCIAVKAVKCTDLGIGNHSAFWRIGIDIIKMAKVTGIFCLTEPNQMCRFYNFSSINPCSCEQHRHSKRYFSQHWPLPGSYQLPNQAKSFIFSLFYDRTVIMIRQSLNPGKLTV